MQNEAITKADTSVQKYIPNRITIYDYIVEQAVKDKLLRKNVLSFIREQNPEIEEISAQAAPFLLQKSVNKAGKDGLTKLANLHPDKELIVNAYIIDKKLLEDHNDSEKYSNCCIADGKKCENLSADDIGKSGDHLKNAELYMKFGLAGIGIAFFSIIVIIFTTAQKKA